MKAEKEKIFVFYKRLISLYPAEFGERFGESLEQTFNDVCNEQKRLRGKISLPFVCSMFAETSVGIIKENLHELKGAYWINHWLKIIGIAAFFGILFTGTAWTLGIWEDPKVSSEIQSAGQSIFLQFLGEWLIITSVFSPIVNGLCAGEITSTKDWLAPLGEGILFGLLLIAPFALMEYWNNTIVQSGEFQFPFLLFFTLWLPPTVVFLGATPIVRDLCAGESILAHPVSLLLRGAFLAFLVMVWVTILRNQMPCFLGSVSVCD